MLIAILIGSWRISSLEVALELLPHFAIALNTLEVELRDKLHQAPNEDRPVQKPPSPEPQKPDPSTSPTSTFDRPPAPSGNESHCSRNTEGKFPVDSDLANLSQLERAKLIEAGKCVGAAFQTLLCCTRQ